MSALVGARVDAVHLTPETGLLVISAWTPEGPLRVAIGVGPRALGVAWTRQVPRYAASARHPLLAAARAHLVGRFIAAADPGPNELGLSLSFDDGARLIAETGARAGFVVRGADGAEVVWRAGRSGGQRIIELDEHPGAPGELDRGDRSVGLSDGVAAELRRAALLKAIRSQVRRLLRRSEAVQRDLSRLDDTERMRRVGRMLLAQGASIPRGARVVTLEDWELGGVLEVTLDPAVPAKQQATAYFHEARRVERGAEQMWGRFEATERERDALTAIAEEIEACEALSPEVLRAWSESARALKVVLRDEVDARGRVRVGGAPRQPFSTYLSADGHRVLVGRGAADNDRLTVTVARPQDLWLHARGYPGAHVVVPLKKGEVVTSELLLDAATLAAHHSDARGQALVEVTWTERRHVRKPRKSPVGQVVVERERVVPLRLEPSRLKRLLASKEGR